MRKKYISPDIVTEVSMASEVMMTVSNGGVHSSEEKGIGYGGVDDGSFKPASREGDNWFGDE